MAPQFKIGRVVKKLFHFSTKFVLKPRGMFLGKNIPLGNLFICRHKIANRNYRKMWKIDKEISQNGLTSPKEPIKHHLEKNIKFVIRDRRVFLHFWIHSVTKREKQDSRNLFFLFFDKLIIKFVQNELLYKKLVPSEQFKTIYEKCHDSVHVVI